MIKSLLTESLIGEATQTPAVRFTFDISDAMDGDFRSIANQYTTFNGHTLDLFEIFSGDGLYLLHARVHSKSPGHIVVQSQRDYVRIFVGLQHARSFYFHSAVKNAQFPLRIQMIYHPKGEDLHILWEATEQLEYMEVLVDIHQMFLWLPADNPLIQCLQEAIQDVHRLSLFPAEGLIVHTSIKAALMEMFYTPRSNGSRQLWIRSTFLKLCAEMTSQLENTVVDAPRIDGSLPDYKRMLEAQKILHHSWQNPPSIPQLASMVGTNACYLKRHFKRAFGTTIYAYSLQLRMEKALKLLQSNEKRISEIAHIVGYKHAAHFTTAFKKHFGVVPTLHSAVE
jgi:AraC-like DNA-binding protein